MLTPAGAAAVLSSPIDIQFQRRGDFIPYPSHSSDSSPYAQSGNTVVDQANMIGRIGQGGYATHNVSVSQSGSGSSHMGEARYDNIRLSQQATSRLELQSYGPVISSAGIRSPLTVSTGSPPQGTSDFVPSFYAQEASLWQQAPEGQAISHYEWSQPNPHGAISSPNVYPSPGQVKSYTSNVANTSPLPGYHSTWEQSNLQPKDYMRNHRSGLGSMTGYPLSPNNSASEERESSTAPVAPPINPIKQPPSIEDSPTQEGRGSSQEPPQSADGTFYCDHPKCAKAPPRFPRRSEWK